MKKILLVSLLTASSVFAQSSSSLDMDPLNIDGNISRREVGNKLEYRRHKLERQTMKKLMKQMEVERIKSEILLSRKIEKAMQKSLSNIEIE